MTPARCPACGDLAAHPLEDNCPTQHDWPGIYAELGLTARKDNDHDHGK